MNEFFVKVGEVIGTVFIWVKEHWLAAVGIFLILAATVGWIAGILPPSVYLVLSAFLLGFVVAKLT